MPHVTLGQQQLLSMSPSIWNPGWWRRLRLGHCPLKLGLWHDTRYFHSYCLGQRQSHDQAWPHCNRDAPQQGNWNIWYTCSVVSALGANERENYGRLQVQTPRKKKNNNKDHSHSTPENQLGPYSANSELAQKSRGGELIFLPLICSEEALWWEFWSPLNRRQYQ